MTTEAQAQPLDVPGQAGESAPVTIPNPVAAMTEQLLQQLSERTISLVQQREQLAQREREAEALGAEITQRRLRIAADQEELLRVQGAVAVLQQLQQGAAAASNRGRD